MPTVFITGANRGLGLEFAKTYAAAGWTVLATARDPGKARELAEVATKLLPLDMTDEAGITALPQALAGTQQIDLLINNAGIYGGSLGANGQSLGTIDPAIWLEVFKTNSIAPLLVTRALLPLLHEGAKVAIVSSLMGSIKATGSPGDIGYRSSKAAVNMVGKSLALELKGRGITVVLLHPGWVQTDMGTSAAPLKPPQSIAGMKTELDKLTLADTGRFVSYDGKALDW